MRARMCACMRMWIGYIMNEEPDSIHERERERQRERQRETETESEIETELKNLHEGHFFWCLGKALLRDSLHLVFLHITAL